MLGNWKDLEDCPCLTLTNEHGTEMEPFIDKVNRTKQTIMCSFEMFEQIPNAVLMEQNDDNIIILEEYLTRCYKMICMYLSKYELIHDKMSPVLVLSCCRLCSFWSENILYLLKILHTSFIMFPHLRNLEAHNLLHQILGKKINKNIQNYLVVINYWINLMSPEECIQFNV